MLLRIRLMVDFAAVIFLVLRRRRFFRAPVSKDGLRRSRPSESAAGLERCRPEV